MRKLCINFNKFSFTMIKMIPFYSFMQILPIEVNDLFAASKSSIKNMIKRASDFVPVKMTCQKAFAVIFPLQLFIIQVIVARMAVEPLIRLARHNHFDIDSTTTDGYHFTKRIFGCVTNIIFVVVGNIIFIDGDGTHIESLLWMLKEGNDRV